MMMLMMIIDSKSYVKGYVDITVNAYDYDAGALSQKLLRDGGRERGDNDTGNKRL